jgi:Mn-dependent DtxR family transcriptional regulator
MSTELSQEKPSFTETQGQYLAFIYAYTHVHGYPPAETDIRKKFEVSPPTVHQMIMSLEKKGFIRRTPRASRSIEILIQPELLPVLR